MNVLLMLPNIKEISKILLACKVEVLTCLTGMFLRFLLCIKVSKLWQASLSPNLGLQCY